MKRPVALIVGAAAGALLVAAVGASAHTGLFAGKVAGVQSAVFGDEATSTRIETPEPNENPEATTETDTDTDEDDNDDHGQTAGATTKKAESGEHEGGANTATVKKDD